MEPTKAKDFSLNIKDLIVEEDIDEEEMAKIRGGFKIFGWEFFSTSTGDDSGSKYGCWVHDDGDTWCVIY